MQRRAFDPQDASCDSPAQTPRAADGESTQGIDRWPTPGEVFFEAGVVLAVALGASVVIQLIMGAA